ncbi:MAG: transposase [Candidatus Heimdallarchaeota archaeon]|nr:MAG: transposase [Candidatus Heimdallarchaeota archaeon]
MVFKTPFNFIEKKVKQIELFQDRYDKCFYLTVTFEQIMPSFVDNGIYQAFDLGITKHTAVNLYGKFLVSTVKRPDKYWNPKIISLQRRRSHCKRGSCRYRLFSQRLVTISRKCRNQTKDWQHKQSKNFLKNTRANIIVVGNLFPKQMANGRAINKQKIKNKKYWKSINRGVHNTGHLGRFVELLTYKAKLMGKRVITIDERDKTKACTVCGHKKKVIPLSERIFSCEMCGTVLDRDCNSAINILKRFLSRNALWTSYQYFLVQLGNFGNLRNIIQGKMKIPFSSQEQRFDGFVGSR